MLFKLHFSLFMFYLINMYFSVAIYRFILPAN